MPPMASRIPSRARLSSVLAIAGHLPGRDGEIADDARMVGVAEGV
jgi:hypothetical protein